MDACSIKLNIQDAVLQEALDSKLFEKIVSADSILNGIKQNLDFQFVTIPEAGAKLKITNRGRIKERQYSKEELELQQDLLRARATELEELLNCNK